MTKFVCELLSEKILGIDGYQKGILRIRLRAGIGGVIQLHGVFEFVIKVLIEI